MFFHLGLRLLTKLGAHSRENRCERGGSCLGYENPRIDYTNVDTDERRLRSREIGVLEKGQDEIGKLGDMSGGGNNSI